MPNPTPPHKSSLVPPEEHLATVEQTWRDQGSPMDDGSVIKILDAYNYVFANKDDIPEYPAILNRYVDFLEQVAVVTDSDFRRSAIGTLINFYAGENLLSPSATLYSITPSNPPNYDRTLELIDLPNGPISPDNSFLYRGHIHFAKRDYANARAAYLHNITYLLDARATYNMAVSCEKLGRSYEAYLTYIEFLRRHSDPTHKDTRKLAADFIADQLDQSQLTDFFTQAVLKNPINFNNIPRWNPRQILKLHDHAPTIVPKPGGAA